VRLTGAHFEKSKMFRMASIQPTNGSGLRWFACGALCVCALGLLAGAAFVLTAHGFSAREAPSAAEGWFARVAWKAALPAGASSRTNPVADTPEVLAEASAHWADHCASCHANDGSGESQMGRRTYPPAPDMRRPATQQLTDGELFYIIQNGVRLTAMPAWGAASRGNSAHDETDSWKLVRFIRHLPALTFAEKKAMEKLNPKGPDDRKEEEEEEKFLKGEATNDQQAEHHHH
jgi:mono/diheme cytochrome c family protein